MGHIQFRSQLLQNQHFGVSILSFRGWRFFVSFKKEPCFTRALRRRSLQARILCRAQARRLRLQAQVNKKEIYVPQKIQGWNGWLEQKSDKCDLYTPFPGSLAQPLKFCHSKRKVVFEPSFFRGYVIAKLRWSSATLILLEFIFLSASHWLRQDLYGNRKVRIRIGGTFCFPRRVEWPMAEIKPPPTLLMVQKSCEPPAFCWNSMKNGRTSSTQLMLSGFFLAMAEVYFITPV